MATRTRRTATEQRQHNRWANLQWTLLALIAILGTIALFVFIGADAGGPGHSG